MIKNQGNMIHKKMCFSPLRDICEPNLCDFLLPLGISQKELADHIQCDYKVVNRIINERASLTTDIATRLASAFNTTPEFWLHAQMELDLWNSRKTKHKIPSIFSKTSSF